MIYVFYTNKGPVRSENQDGVLIEKQFVTFTDKPQTRDFSDSRGLFAVIDGMGGMGGGEIAAGIVGSYLGEHALRKEISCQHIINLLHNTSGKLHAAAAQKPELSKMGVAIAGVYIDFDKAFIFNCGDCRVYQIRSGFLEKRSHDHSFVQELFDAGAIDEDEMRSHSRKNVLTSAISADVPKPQIYCFRITIQTGNMFLICSDGLWEVLPLNELEEILSRNMVEAAQMLVDAAFAANAKDNFSFIIIKI